MRQEANYLFKNWAGNQTSVSASYLQPETETELTAAIARSKKVRLVGTGHSWSDICLTADTLINLDRYCKVLLLDTNNLQITVQGGIKLWQLNEYLNNHGLALKNLGSIAGQSIAGAISTGTHGTGINYQILASQIEAFKLIKPDGSTIYIHSKKDSELFNLTVVSLGALGVVSEITLNVVPAYQLRDQTYIAPLHEVIDNLDILVNQTDHFKLWWFPHTTKAVVYRYSRTQQPANDSRLRQWLMDEFLSVTVYRLLLKLGNTNREWRKNINRILVKNFIQPLDRIEKSYRVFNVPEPPVHREVEWAFDVKVAKELLREYTSFINASNHRINFIQEIRFTKSDNYALSPCYGRDTIWLGAYNADNFGWKELMSDFEELAVKYNGRPHWGKEFGISAEYLKEQYPMLTAFNNIRVQFDPTGKLENEFVCRTFSPSENLIL